MDVCAANTKSGTQSQLVSNYTWQTIMEGMQVLRMEIVHCWQTIFHLADSFDEPGGKGAFGMCHLFPYCYFFSSVRISKFLYANFSSTCVQCTHLLES